MEVFDLKTISNLGLLTHGIMSKNNKAMQRSNNKNSLIMKTRI